MISSVAGSASSLGIYPSTAASSASVSLMMTPAQAGLGDLTAADWKLVSAAVGKNVGPDASGKVTGLQPLLAGAIEMERKQGSQGTLPPGAELTVGDLKAMGANQPIAGFVEQINNAISYLEHNPLPSSGSSAGCAVNITAMYSAAVQSASAGSVSAVASSTPPPANEPNPLVLLTTSDWAVVSASVGYKEGPDANGGKVPDGGPTLAFVIASMRSPGGSLSAGQDLTVSDLRGMDPARQPPGFAVQINKAIAYLESTVGTSTDATKSRIDVAA